ncbi:MAG: hypothetical protein U1E83_02690 [Methylotetracoccus sp.]
MMQQQHDGLISAIKEMIFLFAILAGVGSFYQEKYVAGLCYLGVAAVLYFEGRLRRWLSRHLS